ncbi:hypothetical protein CO652_31785 [Rhizobium sp. H4]|nr:hypothetical protein CO652_31785 [Rhizobium sp. H4]
MISRLFVSHIAARAAVVERPGLEATARLECIKKLLSFQFLDRAIGARSAFLWIKADGDCHLVFIRANRTKCPFDLCQMERFVTRVQLECWVHVSP